MPVLSCFVLSNWGPNNKKTQQEKTCEVANATWTCFFWRLMVEILSSANGYWWRKCSFVFKIVTLNYLAQIQDIHDTITILSAACKHQPSCSADATRDTHHFFPGVGSSCWILQKLSSSQFFWGDGCLPYESLGEVHFHYAAPILNNLSRMWFGHQYLWAQNLFSDVQMRGMDVCRRFRCEGWSKPPSGWFLYVFVVPVFFRVQVESRGHTKSMDPELLSVFLENSPAWMGKLHVFEAHIYM